MSRCLIIGSEGSMGRRYKAIFDLINSDYHINDGYKHQGYSCYDIKNCKKDLHEYAEGADSYIIATPTETHFELILELIKYEKPILCEKPISKNPLELEVLLDKTLGENINLQMVNQYRFANIREFYPLNHSLNFTSGNTVYDYFKHGSDGLAWDCINILGLAKGHAVLKEKSPVWTCAINGASLSLSDMDGMYLRMLLEWLQNPVSNIDYINHAHQKVFEYLENK